MTSFEVLKKRKALGTLGIVLCASDTQIESGPCIVLAGGRHRSRLIDPLESAHLTVVDSTVAGFRITDNSVATMAADIKEKLAELDPKNTVVLVQRRPHPTLSHRRKTVCG